MTRPPVLAVGSQPTFFKSFLGLGPVVGQILAEHSHHDEVVPPVGLQLRLSTGSLVDEAARAVAPDGAIIRGEHFEFDAVKSELHEAPAHDNARGLPTEPHPAALGREDADTERRSVVAGVDPQAGTADTFAEMLQAPVELTMRRSRAAAGQLVPAVKPSTVPGPTPRTSVPVLLLGIDRVAEAVVNVTLHGRTKDDAGAGQHWRSGRHREHLSHPKVLLQFGHSEHRLQVGPVSPRLRSGAHALRCNHRGRRRHEAPLGRRPGYQ